MSSSVGSSQLSLRNHSSVVVSFAELASNIVVEDEEPEAGAHLSDDFRLTPAQQRLQVLHKNVFVDDQLSVHLVQQTRLLDPF
jgi:hypothetical protein